MARAADATGDPVATDVAPPTDSGAATDGRSLRRLNSFEQAVDALLDLIVEGNDAPTAQQIAERSGISVRTVFRLTEDIESLHAAALLRQFERTAHLYVTLPSTGAFERRLRALAKNRATVFEAIAPVRRVGDRLAGSSESIAAGVEMHHLLLRNQMAKVFELELKALPRHRRAAGLDAADLAAGWETWDQLRRVKGLSVTSSTRIVELLVGGVLRG